MAGGFGWVSVVVIFAACAHSTKTIAAVLMNFALVMIVTSVLHDSVIGLDSERSS